MSFVWTQTLPLTLRADGRNNRYVGVKPMKGIDTGVASVEFSQFLDVPIKSVAFTWHLVEFFFPPPARHNMRAVHRH